MFTSANGKAFFLTVEPQPGSPNIGVGIAYTDGTGEGRYVLAAYKNGIGKADRFTPYAIEGPSKRQRDVTGDDGGVYKLPLAVAAVVADWLRQNA